MYVGDDTRTMTFILREVSHIHTKKIVPDATTNMPGQLFRITASPLSAMLKQPSPVTAPDTYTTNTLGFSASRWREIKYVGTRVQLVPLATTGRIDPADITQSASGIPTGAGSFSPQGSIHPYDALNFVHWRRWTGGSINLPAWKNTSGGDTDAYVQQSLAYDLEWTSDDRFNHAKLTDGMQFDSVPLRVDLEASALVGNSLFGYSTDAFMAADRDASWLSTSQTNVTNAKNVAAKMPLGSTTQEYNLPNNYLFDPDLSLYFQPAGMLMPTGGKDYHEQGWLPNPFAGFTYGVGKDSSGNPNPIIPGDETFEITGYLPKFPWFADRIDIGTCVGMNKTDPARPDLDNAFEYSQGGSPVAAKSAALAPFDLGYLIRLCIERFTSPIAILRIPPAYGTMFFWTMYMAHIFQLRKPFLTNSAWIAARIDTMSHDILPTALLAGTSEYEEELSAHEGPQIYQAVSADPYGLAEGTTTLSLADLAPHMAPRMEPRYLRVRRSQDPEEVSGDETPSVSEKQESE